MVNHRKSWAGNVFVWLDLTLDPFFKVERGYCICSISLNTVNDLFSASALVTAPYLFFPMTVHNIHIFFYILYVFLLNKLTFLSRLSSLFSSTAIFTGSGYF